MAIAVGEILVFPVDSLLVYSTEKFGLTVLNYTISTESGFIPWRLLVNSVANLWPILTYGTLFVCIFASEGLRNALKGRLGRHRSVEYGTRCV